MNNVTLPPPQHKGTLTLRQLSKITQRIPFLKKKKGKAILVAVFLILLSGLAGLAALPGKSSGGRSDGQDVIAEDVYFYGNSPAIYPARKKLPCAVCILGLLTSR